ncbi:plasmid mobilization relaxosome protein MobC [Eubacteriales bacterium mix99]
MIRVTPEEKALIQKKMQQFGTENFSRYARKMLIDGYVIHVDLSQFQMLAGEVNKVGININQIAKTVNASGMTYPDEMEHLKEMVNEIWRLLKSFLSDLLSKSR